MYSNTALCSSSLDGHGRRFTSSLLSVAKNVSATVVRVAAGAHRDRDLRVAGGPPERKADVLRALVGMMDQPRRRMPARERHLQRVDDQLCADVRRHRPADDLPGVGVLDRGQIEPVLTGPQIGDVRDPQHVRSRRRELPLDEI